MQVEATNLQARRCHSAAAFALCPGVVEVAIFGGDSSSSGGVQPVANTTVLRFGECRQTDDLGRGGLVVDVFLGCHGRGTGCGLDGREGG